MRNAFFQRRLFSRRDLLLLGALLLLAGLLALLFSRSPRGAVAVIEQNGSELLRRQLSALSQPEVVHIEGENGISLSISLSSEGAQVTHADCPDQTCVRTGKITRAGETALCLPGRVSVRLEGKTAADAETY